MYIFLKKHIKKLPRVLKQQVLPSLLHTADATNDENDLIAIIR